MISRVCGNPIPFNIIHKMSMTASPSKSKNRLNNWIVNMFIMGSVLNYSQINK